MVLPDSTGCSGSKNRQPASKEKEPAGGLTGKMVTAVFMVLLMLTIRPLGGAFQAFAADSADQGGAAGDGSAGDENSGAGEDESGDASGTGEEAGDEAASEEAAEEDPAGEEAEDEDPDEGDEDGEREDNGEDVDDDADNLDDSEIAGEDGLYLSGTRLFALDGVESLDVPEEYQVACDLDQDGTAECRADGQYD